MLSSHSLSLRRQHKTWQLTQGWGLGFTEEGAVLKSEKAPTRGDLLCNRKCLECLEGVMLRLEAEADWLMPCPA